MLEFGVYVSQKRSFFSGCRVIKELQEANSQIKNRIQSPSIYITKLSEKDESTLHIPIYTTKRIHFHHQYTKFEANGLDAIYPTRTPKPKWSIYIRRRIGHTKLIHEHLNNNKTPQRCECRNTPTSEHILDPCPRFNRINPTDCLKLINLTNINLIYIFIEQLRLVNQL